MLLVNGDLVKLVESQQARILELVAKVEELTRRLNQNSRNSSKPPSADGYRKPQSPERKRQKEAGRKPGKQPGAPGAHLALSDNPTRKYEFLPSECRRCGQGLEGAEERGVERRQVWDLPEPREIEVDEYRSVRLCCGECGEVTWSEFPEGIKAPVEYGPRVRAQVVYMVVYQHLSYGRVRQWLKDHYGLEISEGTLVAMVAAAGEQVREAEEAIREQLKVAGVVHFDETTANVNGKKHYIHTAATRWLTLYGHHASRGLVGMRSLGVLGEFFGVGVHDGLSTYWTWLEMEHAQCNAHILRELEGVWEMGRQSWAGELADLLREMLKATKLARGAGLVALSAEEISEFEADYNALIQKGYRANPVPKRKRKRGRAGNLLRRLDEQRGEMLRFIHDFAVPFDNNLAERDLRMVKLQQKISGCWRSEDGVKAYLRIRSYISTARKQGQSVLDVLVSACHGQVWVPAPAGP